MCRGGGGTCVAGERKRACPGITLGAAVAQAEAGLTTQGYGLSQRKCSTVCVALQQCRDNGAAILDRWIDQIHLGVFAGAVWCLPPRPRAAKPLAYCNFRNSARPRPNPPGGPPYKYPLAERPPRRLPARGCHRAVLSTPLMGRALVPLLTYCTRGVEVYLGLVICMNRLKVRWTSDGCQIGVRCLSPHLTAHSFTQTQDSHVPTLASYVRRASYGSTHLLYAGLVWALG